MNGSSIRVRMYHVGFGDCFLVSLPGADRARHVLFDCGVHKNGDRGALPEIVKDILAETGQSIDLVVATHAHQDHISGFAKCEDSFRKVAVKEVWLPWTENDGDRSAKTLRRKQLALASGLQSHPEARLGPKARDAVANLVNNEDAMKLLKSGFGGKAQVRYLEAGITLHDAGGIPGLQATILGPPRDAKFLARMSPPKAERFLRLVDVQDEDDDDQELFGDYRLEVEKGRVVFAGVRGRDGKKTRLMNATREKALRGEASSADDLAFSLDAALNNTSLSIKLSYGGKNLLFPGDAQYGNWESWLETDAAKEILGDIDFYKVSHHGSHNGTPKTAVDRMPEGFAAMASTQNKPWKSIPQARLVTAISKRAKGKLARSDAKAVPKAFQVGRFWIDYSLGVEAPTPRAVARPAPSGVHADPLTRFARKRVVRRGGRLPFNSGEHVWLGDAGADAACVAMGLSASFLRGLKRLKTDDVFSYGELVALSGDFYGTPSDLYEESPALLPWLWQDDDLDDLKSIFKTELQWIEDQKTPGASQPYPENNVRMAWNAKSYVELALANVDHFGWHNQVAYWRWHSAALDLVKTSAGQQDASFKRGVFYNAFADHFLTDGFAAGHIRIPRREIREWAITKGYSDKLAGGLSKLLHDQDGHVNTLHGEDETTRGEKDGLHVQSSAGQDWYTRCDGQLFLGGNFSSPAVTNPVRAVTESVKEFLTAWKTGKLPEGEFAAAKFVPFPHPDAGTLVAKFPATMPEAQLDRLWGSVDWYSKIPWIGPGLTKDAIRALLSDLPGLMARLRQSVAADLAQIDGLGRRLAPAYQEAFKAIS